MATSPYMPFYISDYLSDTTHLSTLEHGAYILLLMSYWQTGKPLPNDDQYLANICRMSKTKFSKIAQKLKSFFTLFENINGFFLMHNRIELELAKYREKSYKSKLAGLKSSMHRRQKSSTDVGTNVERTLVRTLNQSESESGTEVLFNKLNRDLKPVDNSVAEKIPESIWDRELDITTVQKPFPENFEPTEDHKALASGYEIDLVVEIDRARNYALSNCKVSADWGAYFKNWLHNAHKFSQSRGTKNGSQKRKPTASEIHWAQTEDFFKNGLGLDD